MKLTLSIQIKESDNVFSSDEYFFKEVDWIAVPRVGDYILLDNEGGWSEPVRVVFWKHDGSVEVNIGKTGGIVDEMSEGLRDTLIENGFSSNKTRNTGGDKSKS